MNLKPYPEYKDSGVAWLGNVPKHWEVHPLKRYAKNIINNVISKNSDELYIALEHIESWTGRFKKNRYAKFTGQVKKFFETDVLFGKLRPYLAKVAFPKEQGVCVGEILSIRPNGKYLLGSFVEKSFLSFQFIGIVNGATYGSKMPRAEWDFIGNLGFPIISLPEQTQIVRFLDYKTAQIARFIKAKKRMIELLKEQKQVIINDAVTGKIDVATGKPYPKYKDSGVKWLGQVPEHWEVRRLKFLTNINTGGRDTVNRKGDGAYPFFVRSQTVERIDSFSFDGEAILTAGDGAGVAKVFHYFVGKFDYHQRVYKISNFRHVRGKFFFYYFSCTLRYEAFSETAKSTVDSLRLPMLQNFPVPLPPSDMQLHIVEAIETKTTALSLAISRTEREIALIQEYRTRLISDVVTGKIDVRAIEITDIDDTMDELTGEPDDEEELETVEVEE